MFCANWVCVSEGEKCVGLVHWRERLLSVLSLRLPKHCWKLLIRITSWYCVRDCVLGFVIQSAFMTKNGNRDKTDSRSPWRIMEASFFSGMLKLGCGCISVCVCVGCLPAVGEQVWNVESTEAERAGTFHQWWVTENSKIATEAAMVTMATVASEPVQSCMFYRKTKFKWIMYSIITCITCDIGF